VRVSKKKSAKPQNDPRIEIPPGAVIYGVVSATDFNGSPAINVHGIAGPHTMLRAKKGAIEVLLPSSSIIEILPGKHFVAWDGTSYRAMPTMESIQETDDLTFIGSVIVPPPGLLANEFAAAGIDTASASPLLKMAMAAPRTAPVTGTERPPLHPITCEQIDQLLHKVDERHWPQITAMRVKSYHPADTPVPPQAPEQLRQQIRWYASMLFKTEADQYDQFRSDERYKGWLLGLAGRVTARVMKSLATLEASDTNALHNLFGVSGGLIMGYHGLTTQEVEKDLRVMLAELCDQYERGIAPGQAKLAPIEPAPNAPTSPPIPDVKTQMVSAGIDVSSTASLLKMALAATQQEVTVETQGKSALILERESLRDSCLTAFPGAGIMDICWAAEQHYREWTRWLKGDPRARDGSKPDRAFRRVLTCGKDARRIRAEIRPKGWK